MAATARQPAVQPEIRSRAPAPSPAADSAPFEALALLTSGGDHRIALDGITGVNRYGCGAQPDPGVCAFGSSTASTISAASFAAVERLAGRLSEQAALASQGEVYRQELDRIRGKMTWLLGLQDIPGLKTILSPSGTDLHLLVREMVGGTPSTPLLCVGVEAEETGTRVHVTPVRLGYGFAGAGRPRV